MTWTKLSDDFTDDCWTLSDAAYRLHSDGLVWSNRKLLDCLIPKEDVYRFAKRPEAIQELLDAGYWSDAGNAYEIRHHAQYQRKREAVIKQQEANAANGAKGGKARPREQATDLTGATKSKSPSGSLSESLSERDGTGLALDKEEVPETETSDQNQNSGQDVPGTSTVPARSSATSTFCHGCGQELDAWDTGSMPGHCLQCSQACSTCAAGSDAAASWPDVAAAGPPSDFSDACSVVGCAGMVTDHLRREYGQVCFAHASAVAS